MRRYEIAKPEASQRVSSSKRDSFAVCIWIPHGPLRGAIGTVLGYHSLQLGNHAGAWIGTAGAGDINSTGSIEHQHVRRFKIALAAVETLRPHQVPVRVCFDCHTVEIAGGSYTCGDHIARGIDSQAISPLAHTVAPGPQRCTGCIELCDSHLVRNRCKR